MKRHTLIAILGLASAFLSGGRANAAGADKCDRPCLNSHVDAYLAAMQAHDPRRISVADHVLFTENTIPLRLGQGLWATMSGEGSYKLYFDDPDDGQAGFIGTIRENGIGAILVLRLKISRGRISEAEMVVRRNPSDAAALETQGPPESLWGEPLDSGDRPSRQELIRPADLYLEGVLHADGNRVPFAQDCSRILDGTRDIKNPEDRSWMFGSFNPNALDCRENLNARVFTSITSIDPRRYLVIDRERGTVFGVFMFHHRGNVTTTDIPGVGTVKLPPELQRPFTTEVAELFKIEHGKIRRILGAVLVLPYMQPDGWTRCPSACDRRGK